MLTLHEIIRIIESRLLGGYAVASDEAIRKAEEYVVRNPSEAISKAYLQSLGKQSIFGRMRVKTLAQQQLYHMNLREIDEAKNR